MASIGAHVDRPFSQAAALSGTPLRLAAIGCRKLVGERVENAKPPTRSGCATALTSSGFWVSSIKAHSIAAHDCRQKGADMSLSTPQVDSPIRILRLPQVCDVTGLCRSMIYLMEADQRFPKRVKIGVRAVGWLEKEVEAWLTRRIEARGS
jgi:prophage regulatory protein